MITSAKEDIFADRRQASSKKDKGQSCRRQADFGSKDLGSRPWWLKVNYVTDHKTSAME